MQQYRDKLGFALRRYVISLLYLLVVIMAFHSVEMLISFQNNVAEFSAETFFKAIYNDVNYLANIAIYTAIGYGILYLVSDFSARMLFALLMVILIAVQGALMQYYLLAKVPLGADFWNYSWADIKLTIKASTQIKWWQIVMAPLIIGFIMRLHYSMQQHTLNLIPSAAILLVFIILGLMQFQLNLSDINQKNLALNKSDYFWLKTKETYIQNKKNNRVEGLALGSNAAYPFQTKQNQTDQLGPLLKKSNRPPNIVMVLVEGLGKTFVGEGADYYGTMPFLDSLSAKSLFWTNFLSTTGRTFGVLPSVLGSLPYGPSGFMEIADRYPNHTSLVKLLKQNGYYTGFYYGGDATFDGQKRFLESQGIDFILDEKSFPEGYQKVPQNNEGFSWGYLDDQLYKRGLEVLKTNNPYLSVFLTVTTHEPFEIPNGNSYNQRIQALSMQVDKGAEVKNNKGAFKTLMYADEAIRFLIESYKQRPEFENTLFIITGDHRMIPVKHNNELDRYHVPLIIYSPLIKEPKVFKSICSHADLASTLTAYLQKQYKLNFPDSVHWLGSGLTFKQKFSCDKQLAIMRNKGDISELVYGENFLTDGALLKIGDGMTLKALDDDDLKLNMITQLEQFKAVNNYVCKYNKLYNVKITYVANKVWEDDTTDTLNDNDINKLKEVTKEASSTLKQILKPKPQKTETNSTAATTAVPSMVSSNPVSEKGEAAFIMGKVHAELNHYNKALELLQQAIQYKYQEKECYKILIDLELKNKNKSAAKNWYEKAVVNYPKSYYQKQLNLINQE